MAALPELDQWEPEIYQLETTDPVLGGPDGVDNVQGKQLANRTLYLKNLIALLAPLASPALTGNPTAPTQTAGNNTTRLATTAFVQTAITALVNSSPAALDTLNELATALGNDPNFATTIANALGLKAPLASPALTGTPTAPTPAGGTNTTQLATTAFVQAAITALVNSSPAALDTLNELATALGNDPNFATTITNALALKAAVADVLMKAGGTMSGPINMGGNAISNASSVAVAAAQPGFLTPFSAQNTSGGGGGFAINLFASALANAVAGDMLLTSGTGNLLISPNVAGKSIKFISGLWSSPVRAILDDSGLSVGGSVAATTTLKSGGYTVATLPAGTSGMRAYVTDALNPAWGAPLTGGGAVVCPVFYGTAWSAEVPASTTSVGQHTIWIPSGAMTPRSTGGAAIGVAETAVNKVMLKTLNFDAAAAEYAQFSVRMPKSWNEGVLYAYFVWSNESGTGDVVWGLQAVAMSDDDVVDAAFGVAQTVTDGVTAAGDLMQSAATAALAVAGAPAANDWVVFQAYRAAADGADTLAADARLHGIVIIYTTDTSTDA
jgi:hypothetical protein